MNLNNISIILVRPQMGENIGATARAMKNFGLRGLRIVSPRDGWPNQKAHDMAAQAADIIESAQIFESVEAAVADLNMVFATASKSRDMAKEVITPQQAATLASPLTSKTGILFGRESSGLDNDAISFAHRHISIPVSADYDSMNLSQAVCVVCYELFKAGNNPQPQPAEPLSTRKDINEMVNFLERELSEKNFFQVAEKKPGMMINIRNIFTRHFYTEQEVRTLRGIFNALRK